MKEKPPDRRLSSEICRYCMFWYPNVDFAGEEIVPPKALSSSCRRYPKAITTFAIEWCGEFVRDSRYLKDKSKHIKLGE